MTGDNWKTLRVPPEAYEEAKAQKEEADRTWGEQLVAPVDPDYPDVDTLADALATVEERTGRIERQLDDLQSRR